MTTILNNVSGAVQWTGAGALGSSLVFIQSQTASSSASLIFSTGTGTYNTYLFTFYQVYPATSTANLTMQISSNAGSTWQTTGYNSGIIYSAYNSSAQTNLYSTTQFNISGPATTDSQGMCGFGFFNGANNASDGTFCGQMSWNDSTLSTIAIGDFNGRAGTTGANAFKFLFSSGNITGGVITCYGLRSS